MIFTFVIYLFFTILVTVTNFAASDVFTTFSTSDTFNAKDSIIIIIMFSCLWISFAVIMISLLIQQYNNEDSIKVHDISSISSSTDKVTETGKRMRKLSITVNDIFTNSGISIDAAKSHAATKESVLHYAQSLLPDIFDLDSGTAHRIWKEMKMTHEAFIID